LYAQVTRQLRQRIVDGVYAPGSRIPSEAKLVHEFGVSAITVRRAMRDLTMEGLLVGRQGLGVFVANHHRIVRRVGSSLRASLADEIRRSGVEAGVRPMSSVLVPAPDVVAARLGLRRGTIVYRHEKLLLANHEPIGFDVTYLPRRIGDAVRDVIANEFIVDVLRARGVPMDHIDYEFQGGVTSEEEAVVLGTPVGFPLLVVNYTVIGPNGRAVIAGRNASRSDRFTYQLCGHPEVHPTREAR
jgi:DNA-binding GntR family transcriptional regulator